MMTGDSRVWIYQSHRELSPSEASSVLASGKEFVNNWSSHGALMKADFEIRYNRFLIIVADEKQALASGCSIDKCVKFIQEIEKMHGLKLLDRALIAYRKNNGTATFHFSDSQKLFQTGELNADTFIFNNQVNTYSDLDTNWEIPLRNSWLYERLAG